MFQHILSFLNILNVRLDICGFLDRGPIVDGMIDLTNLIRLGCDTILESGLIWMSSMFLVCNANVVIVQIPCSGYKYDLVCF